MRNLGKKGDLEKEGSEMLGKTLFIEKLDVTSDEDINKVIDDLLAKEGRIDVLRKFCSFAYLCFHVFQVFRANCFYCKFVKDSWFCWHNSDF